MENETGQLTGSVASGRAVPEHRARLRSTIRPVPQQPRYEQLSHNQTDNLDSSITATELIISAPKKKSPGPGYFHGEFYQTFLKINIKSNINL